MRVHIYIYIGCGLINRECGVYGKASRGARGITRGFMDGWISGFFFFRWVDDLIVNYIMLERICGTCV